MKNSLKTTMSLVDILLFISFAILLLFLYFKHKFNYWKNLGVPFVKPRIPYGNIQGQFGSMTLINASFDLFLFSSQVVVASSIPLNFSRDSILSSKSKESLVESISSLSL